MYLGIRKDLIIVTLYSVTIWFPVAAILFLFKVNEGSRDEF